MLLVPGPVFKSATPGSSLITFSNPEEQSRHAEMTGLGTRRRHGGKETGMIGLEQRHV